MTSPLHLQISFARRKRFFCFLPVHVCKKLPVRSQKEEIFGFFSFLSSVLVSPRGKEPGAGYLCCSVSDVRRGKQEGREREKRERKTFFFLVGRPNSCLMHGRFPPRPFPDGRGEGGRFPGGHKQRGKENGCCVNTRGVPFTSRAGQKKVGSVLYFPAV